MMDSLMGQFRDMPLKEAKKKKGTNYKESNVCKAYLLGFCVQHEELFKNTKKAKFQLASCDKIHSDALVREFEASPDKLYDERVYGRELLKYLQSLTRKVDEQIAKPRPGPDDEEGGNSIVRTQLAELRENCSKLLAEAEELAEKGDIAGSRRVQLQHDETKERLADYEAKAKEPIKENLCEICGLRDEDKEGSVLFTHTEGRIHLGFLKIRNWIEKLRNRLEEVEEEISKKRDEKRAKEDAGGPEKDTPGDGEKDRRDERRSKDESDGKTNSRRDGNKQDDSERDRDRRDRRDDRGDGDGESRRGNDRKGGGDRGSDRGRERDGDRGYERREDRGYERGYDRGSDRRDDRGYDRGDRGNDRREDRGYDRRGDRGRGSDRGHDDGYTRGRSRSGGRWR